jgi:arginase
MGRGPGQLLKRGLVARLRERGHEVHVQTIEPAMAPPAEVRTAFDLARRIAAETRTAIQARATPLVLAGNCNTAAGILTGVGPTDTGVVWFDAHADFNTPDTTVTGFLDGMALALITGRCWAGLMASVPGFRPVPEENVVLVGARDFDPAEREALAGSRVALVGPELVRDRGVAGALEPRLAALRARCRRVYVHLDLDVLDPGEARANQFAASGGLTTAQVAEALRVTARHLPIAAAALTAYDPAFDADGRAARAAIGLVEILAELAQRAR